MKHVLSLIVTLALLAGATFQASAQTAPAGSKFTFRVPLELINMPTEILGGIVSCQITPTPDKIARAGGQLGGYVPIEFDAAGNVTTAVAVITIEVAPDVDLMGIQQYQCKLTLAGPGPKDMTIKDGPFQATEFTYPFTHQESTPYVVEVSGQLTHPLAPMTPVGPFPPR